MPGLASLKSWLPLRLALLGVVLGAAITVAVIVAPTPFAGASAPPPFAGSHGPWEAFEDTPPTPSVAFLDPDGDSINLDAYRGRLTLVNFWATWCAPCIKELPALDALQSAIGGDDFAVRLISVDRKGLEVAAPFLAELGVTELRTASDPAAELARALDAKGLPITVLISSDGRLLGRLLGDAEWNSDAAKTLMRYYLDNA